MIRGLGDCGQQGLLLTTPEARRRNPLEPLIQTGNLVFLANHRGMTGAQTCTHLPELSFRLHPPALNAGFVAQHPIGVSQLLAQVSLDIFEMLTNDFDVGM